MGIINSGKPEIMNERFKRLIAQLTPITNQGQLTLISGDINIDLLSTNDPAKRSRLRDLIETHEEARNNLNLCQMNFKPTRFRRGQKPSLLDHFMSNFPNPKH